MAREQRQIVKVGVGQEIAAEAVDDKGQDQRGDGDDIDAREAVDRIFAQKILSLADAGEHRAADEIAGHHEKAEHRLMAKLEAGREPPDIDRRGVGRGHDVVEADEKIGRMSGEDQQRADPTVGLKHLRQNDRHQDLGRGNGF